MGKSLHGVNRRASSAPHFMGNPGPRCDRRMLKVDGIKAVSSNLPAWQITVTFDDTKVSPAQIAQTTASAGFPATVLKQ
jgi:hypothetical protein